MSDFPAAGPWHDDADPTDEGRYLVEYQGPKYHKVFVMDYRYYPEHNEFRWAKQGLDVEILRWAEIHQTPPND